MRVVRMALVSLGVLLIVAAVGVRFVAAPRLVKIPAGGTTTTVSSGPGQLYALATQTVSAVQVVATRTVSGDEKAGTSSVAVYDEVLCLRQASATGADRKGCLESGSDGYIARSTDRVAFDRVEATARTLDSAKTNVDGDAAVKHDGLAYTFPIGTAKKSYPFFDTVAGKAFAMQYRGEQDIDGVHVYRFEQKVPQTQIKIQKLLPGVYTNTRTVWVEPASGVIVKGQEVISQRFASNNGIAFAGTLTFTDDTVRDRADFAKEQRSKISAIRLWIPLGLGTAGVAILLVGAVTTFAGRRARTSPR